MSMFRKILAGVSYACIAGAPVLAASGVGLPVSIVLGGVGAVAGGVLHFMDSPKDAKAAAELGTTVQGAIAAVKAAQGK